MAERDRRQELEAFRESFESGFQEFLEFVEQFGDAPVPPDPLSMGIAERTLEDLNPDELRIVRSITFAQLGIDQRNTAAFRVRNYQSRTPDLIRRPSGVIIPKDSVIDIEVFRTNRVQQGIHLHELTFPDRALRWAVGPDQNI